MPLEATMIIIDNSEYMRNGDYQPTRFEAQADAVNVVFQTKLDSNPENTVGIMTMAGKGPEVLVTHTKEMGQILGGIHAASLKIGGQIDLSTALSVAQLALKHRENKNLRQRIIVLAGSPPDGDQEGMVKLAKKLKKNNVAVDIVAFGDAIEEGIVPANESVLKAFVDNINSGDNSHLLTVQPGSHLLSDILISSPILAADRSASIPEALGGTGVDGGSGAGGSGGGAGGSGGGGNDFEFGVDPSLDPELAMALRMSMQEAEARAAAENAASASSNNTSTGTAAAAAATGAAAGAAVAAAATVPSSTIPADPTDDEEARMLAEAIALSKSEAEGDDDDDEEEEDGDGDVEMEEGDGEDDDEDDDDEDEEIQKAIQMSMGKK